MTNPYLINAMQQQQQGQQLNQPMEEPMQRQRPPQQAMPQERYNPFAKGIRAAIESARTSMAMSEPQQQRAIGQGLDAWRNVAAQQPRQRGFLNNLGSIISGMNAGMQGYHTAEAAAQTENQAMAEKLLAYEAQEQARRAKEEDRAWNRDFHERQFGEQVRNNNLLNQFRSNTLNGQSKTEIKYEHDLAHQTALEEDFDKQLIIADKRLAKLEEEEKKGINKEDASQGLTISLLSKFIPMDLRNPVHAEIDSLGAMIKKKMAKVYDITNDKPYNEIPSISSKINIANNRAILKEVMRSRGLTPSNSIIHFTPKINSQ